MATKNISISLEAYLRLASLRQRDNESFSEVINRELGKTKLSDSHGVLSKDSARSLEENIEKSRKIQKKLQKRKNIFLSGELS